MSHDVLVAAGETLIDWIPERSGPLEDVDSFERRPGGAPANVAVALARLERPPLFWTRVGADPFGRYLERILENNGLPIRFVERDPGAKTTLAFVTHDETGERAFTFYRDGTADTRLEPGRIDDETLADCEWVHAGGVTLSSGPSRAATLDLLERAAAAGCTARSIRICGRRYGRTWRRSRAWWATRSLTSTSVSRRRRSSRRSVLMVGHRPNTRGQRSKADRSTPSS